MEACSSRLQGVPRQLQQRGALQLRHRLLRLRGGVDGRGLQDAPEAAVHQYLEVGRKQAAARGPKRVLSTIRSGASRSSPWPCAPDLLCCCPPVCREPEDPSKIPTSHIGVRRRVSNRRHLLVAGDGRGGHCFGAGVAKDTR